MYNTKQNKNLEDRVKMLRDTTGAISKSELSYSKDQLRNEEEKTIWNFAIKNIPQKVLEASIANLFLSFSMQLLFYTNLHPKSN